MFLLFLLQNFYNENLKWYVIHYLRFCYRFRGLLITNEWYQDEVKDSILRLSLELNVDESELHDTIFIHYLPDQFYEDGRKNYGGDTEFFLHLFEKRDLRFENYLVPIIEEAEKKMPIKGMICFGQGYMSLNTIAERKGIKIIKEDISPIRERQGCTQTLFWANMEGKLYHSDECQRRYERFLAERSDIPIFSREELLALFVQEEALPMIPLMRVQPKYEIGIAQTGMSFIPHIFTETRTIDEDLEWECERLYGRGDIAIRPHRYKFSAAESLDNRADIDSFVLSCKRVTSVSSNALITAMMWNRVACCKENLLSGSFMAEKDFQSEKVVDLKFLNYLIFAFQVPGFELFFNQNYWEWRFTYPAESEIYKKHLEICLEKAGITREIFKLSHDERMRYLLRLRGCDEYLINDICTYSENQQVDYYMPVSLLLLGARKYYCRNISQDGFIHSTWHVDAADEMPYFSIDLMGGVGAYIQSFKICIYDTEGTVAYEKTISGVEYMLPSEMLKVSFQIKGQYTICAKWNYLNTMDFLKYSAQERGCSSDIAIYRPKFPQAYFKKGTQIVLYGAGAVGKHYYKQLQQMGDCKIILWVDQKYEQCVQNGLPVSAVEKIQSVEFDYVLVAVKDRGIVREIIETLSKLGIARDTIVWT
jgi:hypothetical protein